MFVSTKWAHVALRPPGTGKVTISTNDEPAELTTGLILELHGGRAPACACCQ